MPEAGANERCVGKASILLSNNRPKYPRGTLKVPSKYPKSTLIIHKNANKNSDEIYL